MENTQEQSLQLESGIDTSQVESKTLFGNPEIRLEKSLDAYLEERHPNYKSSKILNPDNFMEDLNRQGLTSRNPEIRKFQSFVDFPEPWGKEEKTIVSMKYNVGKDLDVIVFYLGESLIFSEIPVDDIVYTSKDAVFSVRRSLLKKNDQLVISPNCMCYTDGVKVTIAPIGTAKSSLDPLNRVMERLGGRVKSFERLALFHEIAHTKQPWKNVTLAERERDAWRYAFQSYRRLRDRGIDLLPGLINREILRQAELCLITFDFDFHPSKQAKERFSSAMRRKDISSGKCYPLRHLAAVFSTGMKLARRK